MLTIVADGDQVETAGGGIVLVTLVNVESRNSLSFQCADVSPTLFLFREVIPRLNLAATELSSKSC